MSLYVSLSQEIEILGEYKEIFIFKGTIVNGLKKMAHAADIYEAIWCPEKLGTLQAKDISCIIERGLKKLKTNPTYFKKYNALDGWGTYDDLVEFLTNYLIALKVCPESEITVHK